MSKRYQKRPSEFLEIDDPYSAYCLDEALEEYITRIEKGQKPKFKGERKNKGDNPGLKMLLQSNKKV